MKRILFFLSALVIFTACEKNFDGNEFLKFYGDARQDIGYSVAIAEDGYVICGQLSIISRTDNDGIIADSARIGIIKTDFNGNTIWERSFGGTLEGSGSKVLIFDNDSVICIGTLKTSTDNTDIYVVKLAGDGSGAYGKIFTAPGNQTGIDILKTTGGFMALGTTDVMQTGTNSSGNIQGNKDILLMSLDKKLQGNQLIAPLGFPGNDYGVSIKHDAGGGYIILGTTDKPDPERLYSNIFLWRINSEGNATEPAFIGGNDDEYAADFEVLDDNYLITGTVGTSSVKQSVFISRISSNIYSAPLFTRKIENPESWSVSAMSRYKNNYFVLAGRAGTANLSRIMLFAIDDAGNQIEGKEVITGGERIQTANDVVSDNEGYVIAVGKNSFMSNSMITLLKLKF